MGNLKFLETHDEEEVGDVWWKATRLLLGINSISNAFEA